MAPADVREIHITGVTLSYLVSSAYSCREDERHYYDLYGHYDVREEATDTSDTAVVVDAIIVAAMPRGVAPRKEAEGLHHVGYLSVSQSLVHKLSWQDVGLLQQRDEAAPYHKVMVCMTKECGAKKDVGTERVEFTAVQPGASGAQAPPRVIPLRIDNVVDSLQAFTTIADTFCRNPPIAKHMESLTRLSKVRDELVDESYKESKAELEARSAEKSRLLRRIVELEAELRKVAAAGGGGGGIIHHPFPVS